MIYDGFKPDVSWSFCLGLNWMERVGGEFLYAMGSASIGCNNEL